VYEGDLKSCFKDLPRRRAIHNFGFKGGDVIAGAVSIEDVSVRFAKATEHYLSSSTSDGNAPIYTPRRLAVPPFPIHKNDHTLILIAIGLGSSVVKHALCGARDNAYTSWTPGTLQPIFVCDESYPLQNTLETAGLDHSSYREYLTDLRMRLYSQQELSPTHLDYLAKQLSEIDTRFSDSEWKQFPVYTLIHGHKV